MLGAADHHRKPVKAPHGSPNGGVRKAAGSSTRRRPGAAAAPHEWDDAASGAHPDAGHYPMPSHLAGAAGLELCLAPTHPQFAALQHQQHQQHQGACATTILYTGPYPVGAGAAPSAADAGEFYCSPPAAAGCYSGSMTAAATSSPYVIQSTLRTGMQLAPEQTAWQQQVTAGYGSGSPLHRQQQQQGQGSPAAWVQMQEQASMMQPEQQMVGSWQAAQQLQQQPGTPRTPGGGMMQHPRLAVFVQQQGLNPSPAACSSPMAGAGTRVYHQQQPPPQQQMAWPDQPGSWHAAQQMPLQPAPLWQQPMWQGQPAPMQQQQQQQQQMMMQQQQQHMLEQQYMQQQYEQQQQQQQHIQPVLGQTSDLPCYSQPSVTSCHPVTRQQQLAPMPPPAAMGAPRPVQEQQLDLQQAGGGEIDLCAPLPMEPPSMHASQPDNTPYPPMQQQDEEQLAAMEAHELLHRMLVSAGVGSDELRTMLPECLAELVKQALQRVGGRSAGAAAAAEDAERGDGSAAAAAVVTTPGDHSATGAPPVASAPAIADTISRWSSAASCDIAQTAEQLISHCMGGISMAAAAAVPPASCTPAFLGQQQLSAEMNEQQQQQHDISGAGAATYQSFTGGIMQRQPLEVQQQFDAQYFQAAPGS